MKIAVKNGIMIETVRDTEKLRTIDTGWEEKWAPDNFKWPLNMDEKLSGKKKLSGIETKNGMRLVIGDPDPSEFIDADVMAAHNAEVALARAKELSILDNLPSWSEVENAVNSISDLEGVKAILKKVM